jgi:hypothetical protein
LKTVYNKKQFQTSFFFFYNRTLHLTDAFHPFLSTLNEGKLATSSSEYRGTLNVSISTPDPAIGSTCTRLSGALKSAQAKGTVV